MKNIKILIEYDGINYHGWQSQINALAIQDVLINAIKKISGEEVNLIGSSRTDVGVHAFGQVANFVSGSTIPADRFAAALNSVLPDDIVIKHSKEVSLDFHSRYCAKGKTYRYLIYNSYFPSALIRSRAFHVKQSLDLTSMEKASRYFVGEHDFSAFRASGSSVKSSERIITDVSLKPANEIIEFEISGNGFLYNMVRIIVGTLVEVGIGKRSYKDIPSILESRERKSAGKTAPAHGLYLLKVHYQ